MTTDDIALQISDLIRHQTQMSNETRLGLAQGGQFRALSMRDKMEDITSLALDLAALLVVGIERDFNVVVFFPNVRLCRRLLQRVYVGIRRILQELPQCGRIASYNRDESITFGFPSGFRNKISVYPTKPEFLFEASFADLILRVNRNTAFDEALDQYIASCNIQRVVDVEFVYRQQSAVDELASRVVEMDIS